MFERGKDGIVFTCDLKGCDNGVETGEPAFQLAKEAVKEAGWLFRTRNGEWKHFCSSQHEQMDYHGQQITRTGEK